MSYSSCVTVIVPCRNESAHIGEFLQCVLAQQLSPDTELEVIICDGASTDQSRDILEQHAKPYSSIRILDNPEQIVSTALNRAIKCASGDIIVRMDVHAKYASDYIAQCVAVLTETGADNVGGPAQTIATGYIQNAIGAAYHSRFASGGARFHDVNYEGYVDTVVFGCWRKDIFSKIGYFDENLIRNQDDDLNLRLVLNGGRIYQSRRIRLWYKPRPSLRKLFSQHYQYGYWKSYVMRKNGAVASLRHLVPGAFVLSVLVLAIASPVSVACRSLLVAIGGAHLLGSFVAGCVAVGWNRIRLLPVMPVVFLTYHFSYGLGFLAGWVRLLLSRFLSLRVGPKLNRV